jgi:hypothetical protein
MRVLPGCALRREGRHGNAAGQPDVPARRAAALRSRWSLRSPPIFSGLAAIAALQTMLNFFLAKEIARDEQGEPAVADSRAARMRAAAEGRACPPRGPQSRQLRRFTRPTTSRS